MCQKQCRDENGFKCHLSSEGHKRQMEIFGQNPERIVEGWAPAAARAACRWPLADVLLPALQVHLDLLECCSISFAASGSPAAAC